VPNKPDWTGSGDTQLLPLVSSVVKEAGYDPKRRKMFLRLAGGKLYEYCKVPPEVFEGLIRAQSPGSFFHEHINGRYPCH
jgi:hypothetical protein